MKPRSCVYCGLYTLGDVRSSAGSWASSNSTLRYSPLWKYAIHKADAPLQRLTGTHLFPGEHACSAEVGWPVSCHKGVDGCALISFTRHCGVRVKGGLVGESKEPHLLGISIISPAEVAEVALCPPAELQRSYCSDAGVQPLSYSPLITQQGMPRCRAPAGASEKVTALMQHPCAQDARCQSLGLSLCCRQCLRYLVCCKQASSEHGQP